MSEIRTAPSSNAPSFDASIDASIAERPDAGATPVAARGPWAELRPLGDPNSRLLILERRVGFTKDDRHLGYEISVCDPCPAEFHFIGSPGVAPLSFKYFWEPGLPEDVQERRRKKNDDEVDRRLVALGVQKAEDGRVLRGPFPYPDLVFSEKTTRDDATGKVTLWFGAHVPGGTPVYPMRVVLGPHPMFNPPAEQRAAFAKLSPAERAGELKIWRDQFAMDEPMLAYANVTKDGKEIGIVALAAGSGWHEAGGVARMPTERFVAEVRGK